MPPGHLARGWHAERAVYRLALPSDGWWVLLEHPDSLAAIEFALGEHLASGGVSALDVAVLRGGQREATVLMAGWIRQQGGASSNGAGSCARHSVASSGVGYCRVA